MAAFIKFLEFNQSQLPQRVKSVEISVPHNLKNVEVHQKKSKGLSIRSNSDLNVSKISKNFSNNKSNEKSKEKCIKNCLASSQKSKVSFQKTQLKKRQLINFNFIMIQIPTLKQSSEKIEARKMPQESKTYADNFLFKKPVNPFDKYPKPETLAYYADPKELIGEEINFLN